MQVADFISTFRSVMGDQELPYLWSDEEIVQYLNWSEQEACTRAKLLKDSTSSFCTLAFTTPVATATLDETIFEVERVSVAGKLLARTTVQELDAEAPGWELTSASVPTRYIHEGQTLTLVPTPSVNVTVKLTVYRLPLVDMTADNDAAVPEIHRLHHPRLLDWVYRCALLKNDSETINPVKAAEYEARFAASFGYRPDANVMRKHKSTTPPVVAISGW